MPDATFAVVYRWRVVPGRERAFEEAWARVTERLRAERGALGSSLHRADGGGYVAYARWPDRAAWQRSRDAGPIDAEASRAMSEALADADEPLPLELLDDRLAR